MIEAKQELVDEINDYLDSMSPDEAVRIFSKLSRRDLVEVSIALRKMKDDVRQAALLEAATPEQEK